MAVKSPVLYFKGLVVEDTDNSTKIGSIAFALINTKNVVVYQTSKPLILPENEMSDEVAQLEAFVSALKFSLSFNRTRVLYYSVGFNVRQFIKRRRRDEKLRVLLQHLLPRYYKSNASPMRKETKVTELLESITLLKKRFKSCQSSPIATKSNAQLVLQLARSCIAKQTARTQVDENDVTNKEKCPICLEDVDTKSMFEIGGCRHRFCRDCLQQHVRLRVQNRMLPGCPEFECGLKLSLDVCREFITPKMYQTMDEILRESSVPVTERVYCPNPRCSYLMSKSEAIAISKSLEWIGKTELRASRCAKCESLFCIDCKVRWHSNMSCDAYKSRESSSNSVDAKFKKVARDKRWRQCPSCSHMVERAVGCRSIYCRCGYHFCYLCGLGWKNCRCW